MTTGLSCRHLPPSSLLPCGPSLYRLAHGPHLAISELVSLAGLFGHLEPFGIPRLQMNPHRGPRPELTGRGCAVCLDVLTPSLNCAPPRVVARVLACHMRYKRPVSQTHDVHSRGNPSPFSSVAVPAWEVWQEDLVALPGTSDKICASQKHGCYSCGKSNHGCLELVRLLSGLGFSNVG